MILDQDPAHPVGTTATRYARAVLVGNGDPMVSLGFVERQHGWSDRERLVAVCRAAVDATDSTSAAGLMQPVGADLIALVEEASLPGRMRGLRRLPANTPVLAQTSGASAVFTGEVGLIPVSALAFSEPLTLVPLACGAIIVQTRELARMSTPKSDAILRRDLQRALAAGVDKAFIGGGAGTPGIEPASITSNAPAVASSGATADDVAADLAGAVGRLVAAGGDVESAVWIVHPRTAAYLAALRGAAGSPAFPEASALGGRLLGLPALVSRAVPLTGSPTTTSIALADASGIAYTTDGATVTSAQHGSLQMDDAPAGGAAPLISLWQENLIALRAVVFANWAVVRPGAVQEIDDVAY